MTVVVSLFAALFAAATAPPSTTPSAVWRTAGSPPAEPAASVWRAPAVVAADGSLRGLTGWRVGLGLGGRAHLLGPAPRVLVQPAQWDDEAEVGTVRVAVRVAARSGAAVYVEARLSRGRQTRTFLLCWDAATGDWSEAATL